MIQQKKTYRFSDDTVITEQNIRQIGELIALSSVRTRMIHSTRDLYYVFQRLYKDIYRCVERQTRTQRRKSLQKNPRSRSTESKARSFATD